LLREAALSADGRSLAVIDTEALQDAERSLRRDFEGALAPSDYALLANTWTTKSIDKEDAYMQLLSNLAILEYNGKELWHDVNPLIESIHAFQALTQKPRSGTAKRRRSR